MPARRDHTPIPQVVQKNYDMANIKRRLEKLCMDHRDEIDQGNFVRVGADCLDDLEWFLAQVKTSVTTPAAPKKKPLKNRHAAAAELESSSAT